MKFNQTIISGVVFGWTLAFLGLFFEWFNDKRDPEVSSTAVCYFGIRLISGKTFGYLGKGPRLVIHLTRGRYGSWILKLIIGPGAGYKGGKTLYIARKCKGTTQNGPNYVFDWQRGFTRNANAIPTVSY